MFFKCGMYHVLVIRQYSVCVRGCVFCTLQTSAWLTRAHSLKTERKTRRGEVYRAKTSRKHSRASMTSLSVTRVHLLILLIEMCHKRLSVKTCTADHSFCHLCFFRVIWTNPRRSSAEPVLQKEVCADVCMCVCAFPLTLCCLLSGSPAVLFTVSRWLKIQGTWELKPLATDSYSGLQNVFKVMMWWWL